MQLGNGLLFCGIDVSGIKNAAELAAEVEHLLAKDEHFVGATLNGTEFIAEPIIRRYRTDHLKPNNYNKVIVEGWKVELSTTLLEFSPKIFELCFEAMDTDKQDKFVSYLDMHRAPLNNSFDNLIWIGDISGGGYLVIELLNPVCAGGFRFSSSGDNESTVRTSFIPRGDASTPQKPLFKIYFVKNHCSSLTKG